MQKGSKMSRKVANIENSSDKQVNKFHKRTQVKLMRETAFVVRVLFSPYKHFLCNSRVGRNPPIKKPSREILRECFGVWRKRARPRGANADSLTGTMPLLLLLQILLHFPSSSTLCDPRVRGKNFFISLDMMLRARLERNCFTHELTSDPTDISVSNISLIVFGDDFRRICGLKLVNMSDSCCRLWTELLCLNI